ncbi:MAG: class I SAM-dependent methyltransferase [Sphingomonas sp.]
MKRMVLGLAALGVVATVGVAAAHDGKHPASAKQVAAALADPARADQASDDARRHAADVVAFAGVGPGSKVVDLLPGGRYYWTRIFSPIVGDTGKVYPLWPAVAAARAEKTVPTLNGWHLANVAYTVAPASGMSVGAADGTIDVVYTNENYHDIANLPGGEAAIDQVNAQILKMLKPGGVYVVIDHADAPGTGLTGTSTKHRIDPAVVKAEVVKAGFVFVGESTVLANPADDHSKNVFDPAIRGHTDQFAYKFRKP